MEFKTKYSNAKLSKPELSDFKRKEQKIENKKPIEKQMLTQNDQKSVMKIQNRDLLGIKLRKVELSDEFYLGKFSN